MILQSAFVVPPAKRKGSIGRSSKFHAAACVAWDETQSVLALGVDKDLSMTQQRSCWQVMVSLSDVSLTEVPDDPDAEIIADSMSVIRPPIALSNTSAEAMLHGLFYVPVVQPFAKTCANLADHVDLMTSNWSRDGAASNKRLTAHLGRNQCRKCLFSDAVCCLHKLKLVQAALTAMFGSALIAMMYSMALLFRSSSQFFLRLLYSFEMYVDANLELRLGPPPSAAASFHDLVIGFVHRWGSSEELYDRREDRTYASGRYAGNDYDSSRHCTTKAHRCRVGMWRELASLLNGMWWTDFGKLVHHCMNPFDVVYRAKTVKRVSSLLRALLLGRMPKVPASNKWVQLSCCVDWILLGVLPHNFMHGLYAMSFGNLVVKIQQSASAWHKNASAGAVTEYEQSINWHATTWKRMNAGLTLFSDDGKINDIIIFAIVDEALRFFATWMFVRGRMQKDVRVHPPLLDLVNIAWSPVLIVRQYLSAILSGHKAYTYEWFKHVLCASAHCIQPRHFLCQ